MLLFGMFATAVAVGVMAQVWKGRTGVLWFALTGIVETVWMLVVQGSMFVQQGRIAGTNGDQAEALAAVIMVCGIGGGAMALAVASLPTKKAPSQ